MNTEEELTPISLRLPTQMTNRIKAVAQRERRSLNSQVILLLEQAMPANGPDEIHSNERAPA